MKRTPDKRIAQGDEYYQRIASRVEARLAREAHKAEGLKAPDKIDWKAIAHRLKTKWKEEPK